VPEGQDLITIQAGLQAVVEEELPLLVPQLILPPGEGVTSLSRTDWSNLFLLCDIVYEWNMEWYVESELYPVRI